MKLKREIENLTKLKKALEEILKQVNYLEYYKANYYTLDYINKEIESINNVLNTLKSMFDDKEYLLEEDE